jgi:hypothetical protein
MFALQIKSVIEYSRVTQHSMMLLFAATIVCVHAQLPKFGEHEIYVIAMAVVLSLSSSCGTIFVI